MNDVVLVSFRYAFATGATALALATVQPSQPFLAVLAAYLLVARPFRGNDLTGCLLAIWSSVAAGLVLVALFPQQFWLLLPAFAAVIVLGLQGVSRWTGPSSWPWAYARLSRRGSSIRPRRSTLRGTMEQI